MSLPEIVHPAGELPSVVEGAADDPMVVDTYAGPVRVEWDADATVTALGHFAFFIEYLKLSGRFDALVADCPLVYASGNAPAVRDVIGTAVLGILAGHWRYAHLTALRGDSVSPGLLGMNRVVSEDAVRRGFGKIDAAAGEAWLHRHLRETVEPLLSEPWVMDCDTTVKPLRSSGGSRCRLQPAQAGASFTCLPHLPDLRCSIGAGCGGKAREPVQLQALSSASVGALGWAAAGVQAASCAGRQGLGQRAQYGAVRAGGHALSVQTSPDERGQAQH